MRHSIDADLMRSLFNYDAESGLLTTKTESQKGRWKAGRAVGAENGKGYLVTRVGRHLLFVHRIAWAIVHGTTPDFIDHVNGDSKDNRLSNLRAATQAINMQNIKGPLRNNKCGLLGVLYSHQKGKWQSKIAVDGRQKHLGFFDSPREAHEAYIEAKRRLHPGCTI